MSKVSPALQNLIEKGLFDRLPATFSTFFYDKISDWELLFPAEKTYYERLFSLIDRSSPEAVEKLFAPLRAVEKKMGVNEKVWPGRRFTLQQVDFLNRSAHYPEWRGTITRIFSQLDPLLDAEIAGVGHARLVVVISPDELPVGAGRMWLRFRQHGKMIPLDLSDQTDVNDYIPQLLTGEKQGRRQGSIGQRYAIAKAKEPYDVWMIESGEKLSSLNSHVASRQASFPVVNFGYDRLAEYRKRLMVEVRKMVDTQDIRGPRQLGEKLKALKVDLPQGTRVASDPLLSEFIRSILLSGNGTLLINNTFVEWTAIQSIRRARPSVMLVSFGVRNKIKPFSSLLIYTEQESTTPIPTQMDALGSYVDLEIFTYYLWLEFEKYAQYRRHTAYLFAGEGMDEMLAIGPPDFFMLAENRPLRLTEVFAWMKEWLGL